MLVKRVTESDFIRAFENMGRKDQFSIEALSAIYEYLEELSESTGESIELDVVALCCEFYEITFDEVLEEQGEEDRDDALDEFERQLEKDHGWVVRLSGSFVYRE